MDSYEDLVRKACNRDMDLAQRQGAFGELVKRFEGMVFERAVSILGDPERARDTVQETFLTVYQNLDQLQNPRAFPSWLKRVLLTECHRMFRKKRVDVEAIDRVEELVSTEPDPGEVAASQELKERVRSAVEQLPEHERVVTVLFYLDGYSQKEIARMVEVPVKTVKSRLYSSRQRLLERMQPGRFEGVQRHRHLGVNGCRPSASASVACAVGCGWPVRRESRTGQHVQVALLISGGGQVWC